MKAQDRKIVEKAAELGITADELLEELAVGKPDKPFTIAVSFARLAEMKAFAQSLDSIGIGIYYADSLDHEYGGVARSNSFVLRNSTSTSKPERMRIL